MIQVPIGIEASVTGVVDFEMKAQVWKNEALGQNGIQRNADELKEISKNIELN